MVKRFSLFIVLVLNCLLIPYPLQAQTEPEKILSYHSQIEVSTDASMKVTETITVRCNGDQIKRGIYRDFPTRYRDKYNNRYKVEFEVIGIQRDGNIEPYHLKDINNGKRIYIGDKDTLLNPGIYTYTIIFRTNRQLGFFKDHDELYWNVTGNGWDFLIDTASATVILPEGAKQNITETDAYTGPKGAKGKDFIKDVDSSGNPTFITTRALEPNEGLTIVVSWKKGFITEPTAQQQFSYFLKDNYTILFALAGLILVSIYYLTVWSFVGKDPAKGTIIPQYYPPKGFSPAAVRYIARMGFDTKAFTATILNLAVKGYLTIQESKGEYSIYKTKQENIELAPEEQKIADKLFAGFDSFTFSQSRHTTIKETLQTLKNYLHLNFEANYFLNNYPYFTSGLIISIFIILLIAIPLALSRGGEAIFLLLFMSVWLSIWTFGVSFLVIQVYTNWKNVLFGSIHRITSLISALFLSAFSLPFIGGEIAGIYMLSTATSGWFVIYLLLVGIINYLFYHLLKAPTLMGRQLLDKIEGFKMFLTVTEKDRLNILNPLGRTPELFERYLPYALALDVEQAWTEQFSEVLNQASTDGRAYSPSWYTGTTAFSALGAGAFASSLGNSFSGAISSSSSAPGSSSGGGGGGW
ncbi:MAG: DUF2207 domain-containing protein [bacterium]